MAFELNENNIIEIISKDGNIDVLFPRILKTLYICKIYFMNCGMKLIIGVWEIQKLIFKIEYHVKKNIIILKFKRNTFVSNY